ncbi:MAG: chain-length determining protein [Bacteroidaceae bacterium]|nr:chain-length determining protein [Bacteroidaceae bacterium]
MEKTDKKNNDIDIVGLMMLLWGKRRRIIINCFFAGILAIVIAFSIPKEYTSKVVMAPEFTSGLSKIGGNIGSLASMAGIDLASAGGEDALYPELYPQIVESTVFLTEIMSLNVVSKDNDINTTLYNYLKSEQKKAWWEYIIGLPGMLISKLRSKQDDGAAPQAGANERFLTRRQQILLNSLSKRIKVDVDKGTNVITLLVTMQDARIASDVVQAVSDNLQNHISNYRTAKARKDLEYTEMVYSETRDSYFAAQKAYAEYFDQHQSVARMQYQIEIDRLENERNLAYDIYNQVANQLELARLKVQEKTPVCYVMQPSVVPFKASKPKKMMMGLLYVFLAFFGTCSWYVLKYIIEDRKQEFTD